MNTIDTTLWPQATTAYTAGATAAGAAAPSQQEAAPAQPEAAAAAEEEARLTQDRLDISTPADEAADSEAEDLAALLEAAEAAKEKFKIGTSAPTDSVARLMQRLVAATGQFEVRMVSTEASRDITNLRMIATMGEGNDKAKAQQILRRLEKLLDKAAKKLEGLNNEDMLRMQQARAESRKQADRAQEIKAELRRKMAERERKERRWLQDENEASNRENSPVAGSQAQQNTPLDAASEAQIAMQAEAQAAMEIAAEGMAAMGGDVAVAAGGASPAAAAEGGGGDVAVAAEGSVDISV